MVAEEKTESRRPGAASRAELIGLAEAVNAAETNRLSNYCVGEISRGGLIQAGPGKGGGTGGWRTKRSGCAA